MRMLRDLPGFRTARINLLHVVSEQGKVNSEDHWTTAGSLLSKAVTQLGLDPSDVNASELTARDVANHFASNPECIIANPSSVNRHHEPIHVADVEVVTNQQHRTC